MKKVDVVIIDTTGNKEQEAGLPLEIPISKIIEKLIDKMELPSTGPDGNQLSYKFIHKNSGSQLGDEETLEEAGVNDGDVLRLQPEITAGV